MLIAFEGIDGTGKATQAALLRRYLNETGREAVLFDFPAYDSFVGKVLGELLSSNASKKKVDASTLPAKVMAMLFALDRVQFRDGIAEALAQGRIVIANRYTLSNSVFQSIRAGEDISAWVDELEHTALGLPRPDLYLVLTGSVSSSKELVGAKGIRSYTESHDVYESNEKLLMSAQALYSSIKTPFSRKVEIDCLAQEGFRSREDIHREIAGIAERLAGGSLQTT
jgi:dTMP kinase